MLGQFSKFLAILTLVLSIVVMSQSTAFCQNNGGGGGGNGGGNGGGDNGGGGDNDGDGQEDQNAGDSQLGGIEISADGVLKARMRVRNVRQLNQQRFLAAQRSLNKQVQTPSDMRKISLTRLEREVEKLLAAGKSIPAEMKYLAGMTKITHVFYYPESRDIVIAGPAEGWFVNADNYVIGMKTGRATLKLDDLVVALRAFAPDAKRNSMITCSIDPTQEGLQRYLNVYRQIKASGQFRPGLEAQVVNSFKQAIGLQQISIEGISRKTNFARVMVEADYQMKLIGIGMRRPAVPITSFISKATPGGRASVRWFFQPDYDCVNVNQDRTAMELIGDGVKLVGEDESVNAKGNRKGKGTMSRASRAFCGSFTKNYSKLAQAEPVWAELRNVIDMSVAAAFIKKMGYFEKADWDMAVFGDEGTFSVEKYDTPQAVAPLVNAVWKQGQFMAPIAGGVSIQAGVALNSDRVTIDRDGEIDATRESITLDNLAEGQWWWD